MPPSRVRSARRVVVVAAIAALGLVSAACTTQSAAPDTALPATAAPAPGGVEATVDAVAGPLPTAAEGEPLGPRLDRDRFASVVELAAGDSVIDVQGNLISVYGLARPSAPALTSAGFAPPGTTGPASVAVDVAMCAPGEMVDIGEGAVEFGVHHDAEAEFVSAEPPGNLPLRSPGFGVPAAGECNRGWTWIRTDTGTETNTDPGTETGTGADPDTGTGVEATVVRYLVSTWAAGAVERHLYQWTDVPAYGGDVEMPVDDGSFPAGTQVRFEHGLAQGVEATVLGWAELIDEPAPVGARAISLAVEVCAPAEPKLAQLRVGLGWNGWTMAVLGDDLEPAVRVDQDSTDCVEQWIDFVVSEGFVPDSAYIADGVDPTAGFARWSLTGAALAEPERS